MSKRRCTALETLLTFWPPAPWARTAVISISPSGIAIAPDMDSILPRLAPAVRVRGQARVKYGFVPKPLKARVDRTARPGARRPAAILRRAPAPRLPRLLRRLGAGDDGRLGRARHQLLDHLPEVPFACARRLRDALALAAVSVFLGVVGRARRPLRPAAPDPARHGPVHGGLARLGAPVPDRLARDLARGAPARRSRIRGRVLASVG